LHNDCRTPTVMRVNSYEGILIHHGYPDQHQHDPDH
jgi:hypothetical protein